MAILEDYDHPNNLRAGLSGLGAMTARIEHLGATGAGQACKAVNQIHVRRHQSGGDRGAGSGFAQGC